jgi:integrase
MDDTPVETAPLPVLRNDIDNSLALQARQRHYIQAATADNTRRSYQSAVRHFERWGGRLPADEHMIIRYLLAHAEHLNPRTLSLRLTALRQWHRLQRFADPTDMPEVRKTLLGIARAHGQPKHKARVFTLEHLGAMVQALSLQAGPKAVRDRALLLLGFFGAFRRSELVTVTVNDLTWETEGVVIRVPRSKTDQTGQGHFKALPEQGGALCPVVTLKKWLACGAIEQGPLFRRVTRWGEILTEALHPSAVNAILKNGAASAGLDFAPELSSHSLRRSLATGAHRAGASFESIKRQGGWSHDGTVREYIDEAQRFEDNAAAVLLTKARSSRF